MFDEELFQAQKQLLTNVYVKGRKDFLCCRKSQLFRPELVLLSTGRFYVDKGVSTCKRILYCSECCKSYLFKKKLLLNKVEEFIQQENLYPTMITLTMPHKVTDSLVELRTKLDKATRGFLSARTDKIIKEINQSVGNVSYIYRNDITYSEESGWNPHCHIAMLNRVSYSENQRKYLTEEYARQLEQAGMYLNRLDKLKLQVDFNDNFTNLSYLAKYNAGLMNLAIMNPPKYIELAQSGNKTKVPPLMAFKKGLLSKFNLSVDEPEEVIDRISLPESIQNLSAKEIARYSLELI